MSGGDPAARLLRALRRSAGALPVAVEHRDETPWSSATFVGAQHRVEVVGTGLTQWLATLPEAELPLGRHFVADVAVTATPSGAMLTILVLEE